MRLCELCLCATVSFLLEIIQLISHRYCPCFRAGRYCSSCGCQDCHNIPQRSEEVQQARILLVEKQKTSTKPSPLDPISLTPPSKGCNCTRSRCLKKYCECFAAGVSCSSSCKCVSCSNVSAGPLEVTDPLMIFRRQKNFSSSSSILSSSSSSPLRPLVMKKRKVAMGPIGFFFKFIFYFLFFSFFIFFYFF